MSPIRILLVDDSAPFLKYLGLLLSKLPEHILVGSATAIPEAMALAQSQRPDLVIMDMSLQEGRGAEIISKLKSDMPGIRVLFISGFEMSEYGDHARQCGADGFIAKGDLNRELIPNMKRLFGREESLRADPGTDSLPSSSNE